jgi:pilus assembly protein CpaB
MKAKKNSVAILVALLLIVVGGGLFWNTTRSDSSDAQSEVATQSVLVVLAPVEAGTPVDEMVDSIEAQQLPVTSVAEGTLGSLDELAVLIEDGYVARAPIAAGSQLTRNMLILPGQVQVTSIDVPANLFEVTIAIESQRALGGLIREGKEVAVLASFDADDDDPSGTRVILEKVLVAGVRSEAVFTPELQQDNALTTEAAIGGRIYVTVAVPVDQLEKLIYAVENGRIWLAVQNEDATIDGSEIRTRDAVIGAEPATEGEAATEETTEGEG